MIRSYIIIVDVQVFIATHQCSNEKKNHQIYKLIVEYRVCAVMMMDLPILKYNARDEIIIMESNQTLTAHTTLNYNNHHIFASQH